MLVSDPLRASNQSLVQKSCRPSERRCLACSKDALQFRAANQLILSIIAVSCIVACHSSGPSHGRQSSTQVSFLPQRQTVIMLPKMWVVAIPSYCEAQVIVV